MNNAEFHECTWERQNLDLGGLGKIPEEEVTEDNWASKN